MSNVDVPSWNPLAICIISFSPYGFMFPISPSEATEMELGQDTYPRHVTGLYDDAGTHD